ncbi:MAG: hypothetical protein ACI9H8_000570 [Lysobacterales bacterium]|jgi:hypothetical protein
MKRISIYLLLLLSMAVIAQQVTDSAEDAEQESEEVVAVQDAELTDESVDEQGTADDPDAAVIAETTKSINESENEPLSDGTDEEKTDLTEVIDPDESEFEPDEEISEDYPVPLPSDI